MEHKMENQRLIDQIEAAIIHSLPRYTKTNDNGTVTEEYFEAISVDGVVYTYGIEWTGRNDGEDGGVWSAPYNIQKE